MTLTLYGSPRSRSLRVLWMIAELGLEVVHMPLAFDDPYLKSPEFLAINPAGAIPTIVDGDFALSESLAINLYLAARFGADGPTPLYPASLQGAADVWRWTLWAQGQLEPWVMRDARLADLRAATGDAAKPLIDAALITLGRALAGRRWLTGEAFTVGDLNVAAVLSPSRTEHLDLSPHPEVARWLARCYARPAAIATRARFAA